MSTTVEYITLAQVGSDPFNMQLRTVCRHWRDVIENMPALWACVELKRPVKSFEGLRAVLKRSQNTSLELHIHVECLDEELLQVITPEMARTQTLILDSHASWPPRGIEEHQRKRLAHCDQLMKQLLQTPAPLLEEFSASCFTVISSDIFMHSTPPRLRHIRLGHCTYVSSNASIFKAANLTTLSLGACTIGISMAEAFCALNGAPRLQHLQWCTYDEIEGYSPDDFERKSVRLPELQSLHMIVSIEMVALVVSVLDFPATTKLEFRANFTDEPRVQSPEFVSLLDSLDAAFQPHFQKLFPDDSSGYDFMLVSNNMHYETDIDFRVVLHSLQDDEDTSIPLFELGLFCHDKDLYEEDDDILNWDYQAAHTEILLRVLGWPGVGRSVDDLCVDHTRLLCEELRWRRVLDALPALASVDVYGASAPALFSTLWASVPSSEVAPALRSVLVGQSDGETIALLFAALEQRVKVGMRRLRLRLEHCDVDAPLLAQLSKHDGVKTLLWDGRHQNGGEPIADCGCDGSDHTCFLNDSNSDEEEETGGSEESSAADSGAE